jgi:hypothetical protein
VHHQVHVVIELPDQVLASPRQPIDAPPLDRGGELVGRERAAPARVEHLELAHDPALDAGRQMAADRLYLGQLGHRCRT